MNNNQIFNDQQKVVTIVKGKGFYVYDYKKNLLSDALVKINGAEIPFDSSFFQYRFLEDKAIPFKLEIEHANHAAYQSDRFYFDTQSIYL